MWPNSQKTAEILNGKLNFSCSVVCLARQCRNSYYATLIKKEISFDLERFYYSEYVRVNFENQFWNLYKELHFCKNRRRFKCFTDVLKSNHIDTEIRSLKPMLSIILLKINSLHKKWSFPLRISSVNMTKSAVSCGSGQIYWRNP